MILLQDIDTVAEEQGQYLRTLRSIQNNKDSSDPKQKKYCRLDQLEHDELLRVARENSRKLMELNEKIKYLKAFKTKIMLVGKETNDDLSVIFDDLKKGS